MTQPANDPQSYQSTLDFWHRFMAVVIVIGGLGLLAIAASAVMAGLVGTALFIGTCGAWLLATVVWVAWKNRRR